MPSVRIPLAPLMTRRNASLLHWWLLGLVGGVAIIVGAWTRDLRVLALGTLALVGGAAGLRWRLRRSFAAYGPSRRRR